MTRVPLPLVLTAVLVLPAACSTRSATVLNDATVPLDSPVAKKDTAPPLDGPVSDKLIPADLPTTPLDTAVVPDDAGCLPTSDDYTQTVNRKVDVLFVVDTGGSMLDERARILATAPVFASAASTHNLDYHIGFVAVSELTSTTGKIPLGQLLGAPAYLDKSSSSTLQAEMEKRLKLGSSTGQEWGLDAIKAALSPPFAGTVASSCQGCAAPDQCVGGACRGPNWGFHRDDASLEIIVFTDEDDGSPSTSGAQAVSFLKGLVDPAKGTHARVHAVIPQGAASCGQQALIWATVVSQTGGTTGDLCAADYTPTVNALASRLFGLKDQFFLTRKPKEGNAVTVTVDGQPASGATYDVNSNSVTFAKAPTDGSKIRISYKTCAP